MAKNGPGLILLDFDGVLFDSVKEAYVVAIMTHDRCMNMRMVQFNDTRYSLFHKYRHMVKEAWNYKPLMDTIDNAQKNKNTIDDDMLMAMLASQAESASLAFERAFFMTRRMLRTSNHSEWLALHEPYDFFYCVRSLRKSAFKNVFIVTTKDKESVVDILKAHRMHVIESQIVGNDVYKALGSKEHIIANIMHERGMRRALFIDDSIEHVNLCNSVAGVDARLAGWGYAGHSAHSIDQDRAVNYINQFIGE